jgi:hypothetical protein
LLLVRDAFDGTRRFSDFQRGLGVARSILAERLRKLVEAGGGQAIHVTNQSMIFSSQSQAHSRLVGCYMLFYSVGSGVGAIASTAVYATLGWPGVCLLGAGVSALALAFWAATLRYMPTTAVRPSVASMAALP